MASRHWYSNTNGEYPAKRGIAASPELQSWGNFKSDAQNLSNLGKHNAQAVMIMDKVGWQ